MLFRNRLSKLHNSNSKHKIDPRKRMRRLGSRVERFEDRCMLDTGGAGCYQEYCDYTSSTESTYADPGAFNVGAMPNGDEMRTSSPFGTDSTSFVNPPIPSPSIQNAIDAYNADVDLADADYFAAMNVATTDFITAVDLANANYTTALDGALAAFTAALDSAGTAYEISAGQAFADFVADIDAATSIYDNAVDAITAVYTQSVDSALATFTSTVDGAYQTYLSIVDGADHQFQQRYDDKYAAYLAATQDPSDTNAMTTATNDFNNEVNAALAQWMATEQPAWTSFETTAQAAYQVALGDVSSALAILEAGDDAAATVWLNSFANAEAGLDVDLANADSTLTAAVDSANTVFDASMAIADASWDTTILIAEQAYNAAEVQAYTDWVVREENAWNSLQNTLASDPNNAFLSIPGTSRRSLDRKFIEELKRDLEGTRNLDSWRDEVDPNYWTTGGQN